MTELALTVGRANGNRADEAATSQRTIHVYPLEPSERDGWLRLCARIEGLDRGSDTLWFDVDPRRHDAVTDLADPFLLGMLFPAMEAGSNLHVHGSASRTLLENLEQFQSIWHDWRPSLCSFVGLMADQEVSGPSRDGGAIVMFSGGLDSTYTLFRRKQGLLGTRAQHIAAALMVLGFDIPLADADQFPAAVRASRHMLDSVGVELWTMRTNFRQFPVNWEGSHAAALAACLHCYSARHGTGVIAGSTYVNLVDPWGSNPMTDPLLSSDRMTIAHDAGEVQRHLKARLVSEWPEAMKDLRVCYVNSERDRNCGICSKCVLTKIAFMAHGLPVPGSLLPAPTVSEIHRLKLNTPWERAHVRLLLELARSNGFGWTGWAAALWLCLARNGSLWRGTRSLLPGTAGLPWTDLVQGTEILR